MQAVFTKQEFPQLLYIKSISRMVSQASATGMHRFDAANRGTGLYIILIPTDGEKAISLIAIR